jgi:hypothetical protein
MWLLAPEFTLRSLLTDYSAVYSSYRRSIAENLLNIREGFGDISFMMALAGFVIAWWRGIVARRLLTFLLLFAGLWLLIWLGIARQVTTHVMLHALLPATVLGNGLAVYGLWQLASTVARTAAVSIAGLICGLFLHVFIIHNTLWSQRIAALSPLIPTQIIPPQHHAADYDNYIAIVRYLREQLQDGEKIYVAASSERLNGELLQSVEESIWNTRELRKIQLLLTADVDSRDFIPLTELIKADIVIVTTPVQYHLPVGEQDLVRMVVEAFTNDWEFSRDFVRLERTFIFHSGFEASIYRRRHPTSIATGIATLDHMRREFSSDQTTLPGSQMNWIFLNRTGLVSLEGSGQQPGRMVIQPETAGPIPTSVVYIQPLTTPVRLSGQIRSAPGCSAVTLSIGAVNQDDEKTIIRQLIIYANQTQAVDTAIDHPNEYLLLQFSSQTGQPAECQIELWELRVAAAT